MPVEGFLAFATDRRPGHDVAVRPYSTLVVVALRPPLKIGALSTEMVHYLQDVLPKLEGWGS